MLAVHLAVAQGAKETAATAAGQNGFLLRMIKAARFVRQDNGLAGLARRRPAEQRGINLHLERSATLRARRQGRLVEQACLQ